MSEPAHISDLMRFALSAPLASRRMRSMRALELAPGVSLLLSGEQMADVLTPAERDARAVAVRLRELAQGQILREMASDEAPEIDADELEALAQQLERHL